MRAIVPGVVGVRNVKWVANITLSDEEATGPWQRGINYKGFAPGRRDLNGIVVEKVASIQEQPVTSGIVEPAQNSEIQGEEVYMRVRRAVALVIYIKGQGEAGAIFRNRNNNSRAYGWRLYQLDVCPFSLSLSHTHPKKNFGQGFAWSGGGRGIIRVDVSIDGGKTWHEANLKEGSEQKLNRAWAWTFWDAEIEIPLELKGKDVEICCKATDASYNVQPERTEPIWNLRGLNNNSWHRVKVHIDED